ncbi:MAG: SDR family oxidoreductase [Bdellovibrionales bacterium]|nr:SDR family oxidoreductase [Bdellovibrionales bacterium]
MKILVLGGAGMLGHQMFLKLKQKLGHDQVGCTLRKNKKHYERFGIFNSAQVYESIDVTNWSELEAVLGLFKPNYVINCVGLTLRKKDLNNFEKSLQINSILPHQLAKWGAQNNARIIHFSTDCVFSGKKGNYKELDLPDAEDLYGKTKFLGEIHYPNTLTFRLSIVGRELEGKTELVEWFLSQKGQEIKGFTKVNYSGLTTNFVSKEVIRVLENFPELHGTYQLACVPISKYELLQILDKVYGTKTKIEAESKYVSDKTLNCDLYSQVTSFQKPTMERMLIEMRSEESLNYDL